MAKWLNRSRLVPTINGHGLWTWRSFRIRPLNGARPSRLITLCRMESCGSSLGRPLRAMCCGAGTLTARQITDWTRRPIICG